MRIYIVRHGIALNVGEQGIRCDAERRLSDDGRRKTEQAARGLRRLRIEPGRIATSPLPRAAETADIIAAALGRHTKPERVELLAPGSPVAEMVEWVGTVACPELLLVGHMPQIAHLCAVLLTGSPSLAVTFKKAAACCLSCTGRAAQGAASLEWLIQPGQLRELGKQGCEAREGD